ncbi:MAG: hypothetical protein OXF41_15625 [bacterium]|nr:hypothetical protein [bacterium]
MPGPVPDPIEHILKVAAAIVEIHGWAGPDGHRPGYTVQAAIVEARHRLRGAGHIPDATAPSDAALRAFVAANRIHLRRSGPSMHDRIRRWEAQPRRSQALVVRCPQRGRPLRPPPGWGPSLPHRRPP